MARRRRAPDRPKSWMTRGLERAERPSFEPVLPRAAIQKDCLTLQAVSALRRNSLFRSDAETQVMHGDLNLDGTTDWLDWHILRANHPQGGNRNLTTLAGPGIPEPSTQVMLIAALVTALASRRCCPRDGGHLRPESSGSPAAAAGCQSTRT
jgi:hypothetical protein